MKDKEKKGKVIKLSEYKTKKQKEKDAKLLEEFRKLSDHLI